MADEDPVTLDVTRAGVAFVRLNRPERHNPLTPDVVEAFIEVLEEIRETGSVRAVLIEGAGKSFSVGTDIEWLQAETDYFHSDNVEDGRLLADLLHRLRSMDQTTVALVNGAATGGGLGLIAACDVAVAVKWAEFRFAEARMGLTPSVVAPYVIEAVGPRWARFLFSTAKAFDAELAQRIGLVQYVVEDLNDMQSHVEDLVEIIFQAAPGAVRAAKKIVDDVMWREINSGLRNMTADRYAKSRESVEGKEGVAAVLAKRKPSWAE